MLGLLGLERRRGGLHLGFQAVGLGVEAVDLRLRDRDLGGQRIGQSRLADGPDHVALGEGVLEAGHGVLGAHLDAAGLAVVQAVGLQRLVGAVGDLDVRRLGHRRRGRGGHRGRLGGVRGRRVGQGRGEPDEGHNGGQGREDANIHGC